MLLTSKGSETQPPLCSSKLFERDVTPEMNASKVKTRQKRELCQLPASFLCAVVLRPCCMFVVHPNIFLSFHRVHESVNTRPVARSIRTRSTSKDWHYSYMRETQTSNLRARRRLIHFAERSSVRRSNLGFH